MSQGDSQRTNWYGYDRAFVSNLQRLVEREDRAALAELRRGLCRPTGATVGMYRYVVPYLPPEAETWDESPYFLVAPLFALHQLSWPGAEGKRETNFGASFSQMATGESASVEKRFTALLNAEPEELGEHLRHAVSLFKAHEVPVDWFQLPSDVRGWDHPERYVQRRWARMYWRASSNDNPDDNDDTITR